MSHHSEISEIKATKNNIKLRTVAPLNFIYTEIKSILITF